MRTNIYNVPNKLTSNSSLVLSKVLIEELRTFLQEGSILHDSNLSTDASSGGNILFGSLNQTVRLVTIVLVRWFSKSINSYFSADI